MHGVIETFDISKNGVLSSGAGIETTQINEFALQASEKILRNGVGVRIALTRHALTNTELRQAPDRAGCIWLRYA